MDKDGLLLCELQTQAIERILEAKGILCDVDSKTKRQYEIFRKIRNEE
ncbi:hypothetical protein SAMN05421730_10278 [Anaerobium acetethylicum]|uniref:Uncharacterized protein n=1 Tax=Anaerobium acetethylicum TaxID=1619234 RepID=A0A1D3TWZ7_9FIRM|nr:hypothetical protein SAMN05421730_10278 [Anaerobium acetethylicum]